MNIEVIVKNRVKKGNEILAELSELMPEYKDYRIGEKSMYTPKDMVKGLETLQNYNSFRDNLLNGSPKAQ